MTQLNEIPFDNTFNEMLKVLEDEELRIKKFFTKTPSFVQIYNETFGPDRNIDEIEQFDDILEAIEVLR